MSESEHNVDDDAENHRFANRKGGLDAQLIYCLEEDRLILMHSDVPEELAAPRHRRAARASNRRRGRKTGETVVPWCPCDRKWFTEHSDIASRAPSTGTILPGLSRRAREVPAGE